MKRHGTYIFFLIFLLFTACNDNLQGTTVKKLNEVMTLRQKLQNKLIYLHNAGGKLTSQMDSYIDTVNSWKELMPEASLEDAIKDKMIKGRLEGIQKARAYINIIKEEIELTTESDSELSGVQIQLELDMAMLQSIGTENVDQLLEKLDVVLTKVLPTANDLVINDQTSSKKMEPLEDIWKELITK